MFLDSHFIYCKCAHSLTRKHNQNIFFHKISPYLNKSIYSDIYLYELFFQRYTVVFQCIDSPQRHVLGGGGKEIIKGNH